MALTAAEEATVRGLINNLVTVGSLAIASDADVPNLEIEVYDRVSDTHKKVTPSQISGEGTSATSVLLSDITLPAVGASVTLDVADNRGFAINQYLLVSDGINAGSFRVTGKSPDTVTPNTVTGVLEDSATNGNAGDNVTTGALVVPTGLGQDQSGGGDVATHDADAAAHSGQGWQDAAEVQALIDATPITNLSGLDATAIAQLITDHNTEAFPHSNKNWQDAVQVQTAINAAIQTHADLGNPHKVVVFNDGTTAGQQLTDVVPDFADQLHVFEDTIPHTLYKSTSTTAGQLVQIGTTGTGGTPAVSSKSIDGVSAGETLLDVVPDAVDQLVIDTSQTPEQVYRATATTAGAITLTGDGDTTIQTGLADIAAIKAVPPADRVDKQVETIDVGPSGLPADYLYRAASADTADDVNVIQPTVGAGRWHIVQSPAQTASPVIRRTLTTNLVLTSADILTEWIQIIDPGGVNRTVDIPPEGIGQVFRLIVIGDSVNTLTINSAAADGGATITTMADQAGEVMQLDAQHDGTDWVITSQRRGS